MTAPTGFGAQGLHPRKCLWCKGKKGLSTPRALLYYYDYVFIKTLKKKTEEQPGTRSAGPCGTPGRRWRWKRQETPALAARCGGSGAVPGPSKAVRQSTTRWMTSTAGGGRCNGAVRARPLGGAGRGEPVVRTAHRRQKLWAPRGKPAQGAGNTLSPVGLA